MLSEEFKKVVTDSNVGDSAFLAESLKDDIEQLKERLWFVEMHIRNRMESEDSERDVTYYGLKDVEQVQVDLEYTYEYNLEVLEELFAIDKNMLDRLTKMGAYSPPTTKPVDAKFNARKLLSLKKEGVKPKEIIERARQKTHHYPKVRVTVTKPSDYEGGK